MTPSTHATKQAQLDALHNDLRDHSVCPLRTTATQPVPGEGNPDAKIFFIGEAPGKNEDLTGRPFIGQAGKVLTELLASVGLQREDVFITSIEKFRPPNNRVPTPEEIMACFPYLEKQIEIIQPKIIVTLGRYALQRMLQWETGTDVAPPSMAEYHGKKIVSKKGFLYLPLYHPAAMLYNRKLAETMKHDFALIVK
jgi:uracil-DNA glycosylase